MEWEKPSSRRVKDFALYSGRLKHIDWKAAIETGVDWKDPNFPTNGDSILDKDIPKQPAHDSWRNFTWKRPRDVYGYGNYVLYDEPGPNDIQ